MKVFENTVLYFTRVKCVSADTSIDQFNETNKQNRKKKWKVQKNSTSSIFTDHLLRSNVHKLVFKRKTPFSWLLIN